MKNFEVFKKENTIMKKHIYSIRLCISVIIVIMAILGFYGLFYPVKFMNLQIAPLIQRVIFDFSIIAAALLVLIIVLTVIFGRFYCSLLCPFGILQEVVSILLQKFGKGYYPNKWSASKWDDIPYGYLTAGLVFGVMAGGTSLLVRYIEPYSIFGTAVTFSVSGLIITAVVFVLLFFKNRFFCTNICPVGAILRFISQFSVNKIYIGENCNKCGICAGNCPSYSVRKSAGIPLTGAAEKPSVNNETCIRCLKCLSVCPNNAVKFGISPVKHNGGRRDFIFKIGAAALLCAGYSAGINFTKSIVQKVKNIILPAGAVDTERMLNLCLNCNLCVGNCPNKILTKADENFSAVHIDYSKGNGFCEYKCNKCSSVCPSGAVKKITLEEKQKTKIASATVTDSCIGCRICEKLCPTGAITINLNNTAIIDELKCIGCGRCAANCNVHSIKIFAINEQTII